MMAIRFVRDKKTKKTKEDTNTLRPSFRKGVDPGFSQDNRSDPCEPAVKELSQNVGKELSQNSEALEKSFRHTYGQGMRSLLNNSNGSPSTKEKCDIGHDL